MTNENSDRIVMTDDTGIVFSEEEIAKQLKKIKQMIEYKNKSAKEMFEENDYTLLLENEYLLIYQNINDKNLKIVFYKKEKGYQIVGFELITMDMQRVVNKQCKELCWLE